MRDRLCAHDREWGTLPEWKKDLCRDWLKSCGGNPWDTMAVRVEGEGHCIAEVYCREENGQLMTIRSPAPPHEQHPCVRDVTLTARTPPPWWEEGFLVDL